MLLWSRENDSRKWSTVALARHPTWRNFSPLNLLFSHVRVLEGGSPIDHFVHLEVRIEFWGKIQGKDLWWWQSILQLAALKVLQEEMVCRTKWTQLLKICRASFCRREVARWVWATERVNKERRRRRSKSESWGWQRKDRKRRWRGEGVWTFTNQRGATVSESRSDGLLHSSVTESSGITDHQKQPLAISDRPHRNHLIPHKVIYDLIQTKIGVSYTTRIKDTNTRFLLPQRRIAESHTMIGASHTSEWSSLNLSFTVISQSFIHNHLSIFHSLRYSMTFSAHQERLQEL